MRGNKCAAGNHHRYSRRKRGSAAAREHLSVYARDRVRLHDLENRAYLQLPCGTTSPVYCSGHTIRSELRFELDVVLYRTIWSHRGNLLLSELIDEASSQTSVTSIRSSSFCRK